LDSKLLSRGWAEIATQPMAPPQTETWWPPAAALSEAPWETPSQEQQPAAPAQPAEDDHSLLPSAPRPDTVQADQPGLLVPRQTQAQAQAQAQTQPDPAPHLISRTSHVSRWHGDMKPPSPEPMLAPRTPQPKYGAPAGRLSPGAELRPQSLTVQSIGDAATDPVFQEALKVLRNVSRLNILIAGQTGVGKSTLINAILGETVAAAASGRPVTAQAEWFASSRTPLRLMDTKGIEAKDYQATLQLVQTEADQARRTYDVKDQLHMGWVCMSTQSHRVQDCDVELVKMLNRMEIPVVAVLTKDDDDPHFAKLVNLILAEQGARVQSVISVRAEPIEGKPPSGLGKLMMAAIKAMPQKLLEPATAAVDQEKLMAETAKHLRSIGRVNILVAGQTGVGKSTLINAVFGESFAQTAAGRPVTQHAEWYGSPTVPLRILDTKGLEAKDYDSTLRSIRQEIERGRNATDTKDQLHIGWVCISTQSSRVQDCEIDIIRMLNRFDIPAIVVLTKDDDDPNFPDIVACIMAKQRAYCRGIVPVRAVARRSIPAAGLENLVMATYKALPDAHRAAFAAAQKINRDLNRKAAEDYVNAAALAAAAASVIPIPLVDLATLAPIQAGMMLGISSAFGLTLDRQQIMQVITTTLGTLAASFAGKWAVGNVLKFIPGPGSIVGSALNAAVAGAITRGIGTAFIRFLYRFMERNNRVPSADEILDVFPTFYKMGEANR
jgi:predicted GTPase